MNSMKKVVALLMSVMMVASMSAVSVGAKTKAKPKTKTVKMVKNTKYSHATYTLKSTVIEAASKKVNTPGIKKTKYTTGSVTVSKTQSFSVSASAGVDATFKTVFGSLSAKLSVGKSASTSITKGTVLNLEKNAPNGIYYAYLVIPRRKLDFNVRKCNQDYVDWYSYKKTIKSAPMVDKDYLTFKKLK